MSKEVQLTLSLTEQQAEFLKQFAAKQYPGAKDNLCTSYPIHVVESTTYSYIPHHEDLSDYFDDETLKFCFDEERENWFDEPHELVEEWFEYNGEDSEIPVKEYDALHGLTVESVDGKSVYVSDYESYFEVYGVENLQMAWTEKYYKPEAYFFILDEAKRYMKYQAHNLRKPSLRVFSHAVGYDNRGDIPHFWELLMKVGTQLNEIEKGVDSNV